MQMDKVYEQLEAIKTTTEDIKSTEVTLASLQAQLTEQEVRLLTLVKNGHTPINGAGHVPDWHTDSETDLVVKPLPNFKMRGSKVCLKGRVAQHAAKYPGRLLTNETMASRFKIDPKQASQALCKLYEQDILVRVGPGTYKLHGQYGT